MFPINFKKERSIRYMKALNEGLKLESEGLGWTVNEMSQLGGACFFALLSHGPMLKRAAAEIQGKEYKRPETMEYSEAEDESVYNDAHAAIEFNSMLTQKAWDGEYDEHFENFVQAAVKQTGETHPEIAPIKGFKGMSAAKIVPKSKPESKIEPMNEEEESKPIILDEKKAQEYIGKSGVFALYAQAVSISIDESNVEQPIGLVLHFGEETNIQKAEATLMMLTPQEAEIIGKDLISYANQYGA